MSTQRPSEDAHQPAAEHQRLYPGGGADRGLPNTDLGELSGPLPDIAGDIDLGTSAGRAAALSDPATFAEPTESKQAAIADPTRRPHDTSQSQPTPRGVLPTSDLTGAADANPLEGSAGELERTTATGSGGLPDRSVAPGGSALPFEGVPDFGMGGALAGATDNNAAVAFDEATPGTTSGSGGIPDRGTAVGQGTLSQHGAGGGTTTGDGGMGPRATDTTAPHGSA
jgi:hypothetical protein